MGREKEKAAGDIARITIEKYFTRDWLISLCIADRIGTGTGNVNRSCEIFYVASPITRRCSASRMARSAS
jgi:hypothetical protein